MPQADAERWEYETLRPPRGETKNESEDPIAEINELAAEGWRLVETIDYTGGGTKYLVFERAVHYNRSNETCETDAVDGNES